MEGLIICVWNRHKFRELIRQLKGLIDKGMAAGSAAWKAIDGATGALVAPGTAGTVKRSLSASGTADWTIYCGNGVAFSSAVNSTGANPVGATALQLLKQHGLFPIASSGLGGDGYWGDVTGERLPIRA